MDHVAAVRALYGQVVGPMDGARAAALVDPTCDVLTPIGRLHGPAGFLMWAATLKVGFPDLVARPVDVTVVPGGARWVLDAYGTHTEEFFGLAATGRAVRLRGAESAAFAPDGRCVWFTSDVGMVDAMLQLGAIPELAATPG